MECAYYFEFEMKAKVCIDIFRPTLFALPDRAPSAFLCASAFTGSGIYF
jgi:hypothetical protein